MLGLRDNLTLSLTKLRVRRVRLIITLVVAGILFTTLVFSSLVVRGAVSSLESFTQEGLLNHFIASVQFNRKFDLAQDKTFITRAEAIEKVRVAEQVKEAKRLGLDFDPKTAPKPTQEYDGPGGKQKFLDLTHPAARQAISELVHDTALAQITKAAEPYHPKAIYQGMHLSTTITPGEYGLTPIVKDKEQEAAPFGGGNYGLRDSLTSFQNDLAAFDNGLLKPFLLDGTSLSARAGEPIPILVPIDAAEKLLGVKALPKKAAASAKIERLGQMRSSAKNLVFEVCYRNKTAIDLKQQAKQQADEITSHKGDSTYQKPALVYSTSAGVCQSTPILSDTRSAAEKALAAKQEQFAQKFGALAPVTTRVQFRVVGILPQPGSMFTAQGPESLISSFFTSTLGEGWFMSREAANLNPVMAPLINNPLNIAVGSTEPYVDFPDRLAEKRFIEEKSCNPTPSDVPDCTGGKFYVFAFGNPLAVIYDLGPTSDKAMRFILGVIALLSAIVMMGTIGKVVADSRKETSVFRAVGAKRHEIAQIYLLYTAILATLSYIIALVIGVTAALYVEMRYSPNLSAQAVLAFNSHDLHKTFHLIGLNLIDFAAIYGFVLIISLLSAGIPLLTNLSRSPVKDMREE